MRLWRSRSTPVMTAMAGGVPDGFAVLVVANGLNAVAERCADERALLPSDQSARDGADHGAFRAAVGLRPTDLCDGASGRQQQRAGEHCRLKLAIERSHGRPSMTLIHCEPYAANKSLRLCHLRL